jgi:hypothetical protein
MTYFHLIFETPWLFVVASVALSIVDGMPPDIFWAWPNGRFGLFRGGRICDRSIGR